MFRSSLPRHTLPSPAARLRSRGAAGVALAVGTAGLAVAAWAGPAQASSSCTTGATVTCTYTGAGTYSFTVPAGVTSLDVTAVGAAGGDSPTDCTPIFAGGAGAAVEDTAVPVSTDQGQALTVIVGGVGGNGSATDGGEGGTPGAGGAGGDYPGGNPNAVCDGGGGGGFSGLLDSGTALVIGAGGGGAGTGGPGGAGGTAASINGDPGSASDETDDGGPGGGGGVGGMGGTAGSSANGGGAGNAGMSLQGGQGGTSNGSDNSSGGGGGGGYFGGGGGGGGFASGGGGGGSSYPTTGLIAAAAGPASVTISYKAPVITRLSPDRGPSYGFTPVLITGSGLACPAHDYSCKVTVTFGQRRALVVLDRPTKIWVLSPPGSGTVPVTVTVGGVSSQPATFTYLRFL